jgi:short subunit dehydrogenase-like uncharacterized protein
VQQLPADGPIEVEGVVRAGGRFSGGTFASALTAFSRARQTVKTGKERRRAEPRPDGRRVHGMSPKPRHDSELGCWLLPFPSIDPQIIHRSARALDRYGPDFGYAHYVGVKHLPVAAGLVCGVGTLFALAQLPPARRLLLDRLPAGEGPSDEQMEKGWFKVRFKGEGGGRRVICQVSGGDPGYGETAKMLAESALCLAFDDNPEVAGNVTTATAMAENLVDRLVKAGIGFDVLEST